MASYYYHHQQQQPSIVPVFFSKKNKESIVDLINSKYANNEFSRKIYSFAVAIKKHYGHNNNNLSLSSSSPSPLLVPKQYVNNSEIVLPRMLEEVMSNVIESTSNVSPQHLCWLNEMVANEFLTQFFVRFERDLIVERTSGCKITFQDTLIRTEDLVNEKRKRSSHENNNDGPKKDGLYGRDFMSGLYYKDLMNTFYSSSST